MPAVVPWCSQADAERLASNAAASTSGSSSGSRAKRIKPGSQDFVSAQQRLLFSLCDSYADVLHAAKPYPGGPGWSPDEPDEAMDAVLLHVLNHCAKTADVIKRNNDKLKAPGPGELSTEIGHAAASVDWSDVVLGAAEWEATGTDRAPRGIRGRAQRRLGHSD